MLVEGKGIVLTQLKYGDQSIIVHILHQTEGVRSYMVHAPRAKRSSLKCSFLQPLQLIDYIGQHRVDDRLDKIKEVSSVTPLHGIATHVVKSALAMFMGELLYRVLEGEEASEELFNYLEEFVLWLNASEDQLAEVPIQLMYRLSVELGFQPSAFDSGDYFDLREGRFTGTVTHPDYLDKEASVRWRRSLESLSASEAFKLNDLDRSLLLEDWISFFRIQKSGLREIKSLSILRALFH